MSLPPFPVDDVTLTQVEAALNTSIEYVDGKPHRVGGDVGLHELLDQLSGVDHADDRTVERIGTNVYYDPRAHYTVESVVHALIAECRRLRSTTNPVVDDPVDQSGDRDYWRRYVPGMLVTWRQAAAVATIEAAAVVWLAQR